MQIDQLLFHQKHIKYSAIISAIYNSAVVKYFRSCTVFSDKGKADIIIFLSTICIDLIPDAFLNRFLLRFMDQITEALLCISKKLIHILTSGKLKHLMVCKQQLVILQICPVN